MEEYKNEKYLKNEIMDQSRHQFIYGYNNEHRSNFFKSLEKDYPLTIDANKPTALYFDCLGMPQLDVDLNEKNKYLIDAASREYLSFAIVTKILEKSMEFDKTILDTRLSRLINIINESRNAGYTEIEKVTDLLKEIKTSRDFYYENYINYVKGLTEKISIDDISIPFLQLEIFVRLYNEAMNMDSYFGIIFDKKNPLAISSTKAINNLIGARINKDISMKIVTEPDNWETYKDVNGQFIEAIHDYGTIELDNSYEDMKKLTKKPKQI